METAWNSSLNKPTFPRLTKNVEADVVVVGGGLTGILSAYLLAKSGKKVVLLEKETIGNNATLHTTAFLTQVIDTNLATLINMFGLQKAKQIVDSHGQAITMLELIASTESIECDFMRCPAYLYAATEKQNKALRQQYEAAVRLDLPVKFNEGTPLGFEHHGYMEVERQGKFHVGKFIYALAQKCVALGVGLYEHAEVTDISGSGTFTTAVGERKVRAQDVVIATYQPLTNEKTRFKKGMYVSYVIEVVSDVHLREALYWDFSNPYNYFRVEAQNRIILGGADHRSELPMNKEKNFQALESYLQTILSGAPYTMIRKWAGPILEPSDGIALIGSIEPHKYIASAFSGNGMTYAAIAARILYDDIAGEFNPWSSIYDPTRVPSLKQLVIKAKDYGGELLGGAFRNIVR